jgi:hypothetical protein
MAESRTVATAAGTKDESFFMVTYPLLRGDCPPIAYKLGFNLVKWG